MDLFSFVFTLLLFCRSEIKLWSPLSSEGGKSHPYKMNLVSESKVCVCLNSELNSWEIPLTASYTVPGRLQAPFPLHPQRLGFFLDNCQTWSHCLLPTGGFLGDGSLSAKFWHCLQFLPTEWKVEARMWLHVGNGLTCLRLCVFYRCALFLV